MKSLKDDLSSNKCLVHADFSENYACKLELEVQGMHFGDSRNQVSLPTGVLYKMNTNPLSFCTISGNTRHDPGAIWAYLSQILSKLKNTNPDIDTVNFLSDDFNPVPVEEEFFPYEGSNAQYLWV